MKRFLEDPWCPLGHVYECGDTLIVPTGDPATWPVDGVICVHRGYPALTSAETNPDATEASQASASPTTRI